MDIRICIWYFFINGLLCNWIIFYKHQLKTRTKNYVMENDGVRNSENQATLLKQLWTLKNWQNKHFLECQDLIKIWQPPGTCLMRRGEKQLNFGRKFYGIFGHSLTSSISQSSSSCGNGAQISGAPCKCQEIIWMPLKTL